MSDEPEMTFKTKVMLWLGAVFAGFTAAVLFTPHADRDLWSAIIGSSGVFAFLAFAFNPVRWALIAVPGFLVTVAGFHYFRVHPTEPSGIAALVTTVIGNSIIVWVRVRKKPTDSHP